MTNKISFNGCQFALNGVKVATFYEGCQNFHGTESIFDSFDSRKVIPLKAPKNRIGLRHEASTCWNRPRKTLEKRLRQSNRSSDR